jgi:hypothetical protein
MRNTKEAKVTWTAGSRAEEIQVGEELEMGQLMEDLKGHNKVVVSYCG